MTENLTDMVKNHQENSEETKTELDIEETKSEETVEPNIKVEETDGPDIDVMRLSDWFVENSKNFGAINHVKADIRGVDSNDTLIMTVPTPTEAKPDKRRLVVIDEASIIPVLNLPAEVFEVYPNETFRIVSQEIDGKVIKSYGVKTGIIVTHCVKIDDYVVPYKIERIKKKHKDGLSFIDIDADAIKAKLSEETNIENLEIQYKQLTKAKTGMSTVEDVMEWMLERQVGITDVNHHLKLDELIIQMIS